LNEILTLLGQLVPQEDDVTQGIPFLTAHSSKPVAQMALAVPVIQIDCCGFVFFPRILAVIKNFSLSPKVQNQSPN
jgi:hypothetical protein